MHARLLKYSLVCDVQKIRAVSLVYIIKKSRVLMGKMGISANKLLGGRSASVTYSIFRFRFNQFSSENRS